MTELWDLLDGERCQTELTIKRGQSIPHGFYHLVISVWIMNSKGQYLLSQRHPSKPYPYYWECTGGSVLSKESSLRGALREVKEELGIELEPQKAQLLFQFRRDRMQDFYDVWHFQADFSLTSLHLQSTEVSAVQWVDRETLSLMFRQGKLHPLLDYIDRITDKK